MARQKSLTGRTVTVTETKSTDVTNRHWWIVEGTAQAVLDYLEENRINHRMVSHFSFVSSTWYCIFYKN